MLFAVCSKLLFLLHTHVTVLYSYIQVASFYELDERLVTDEAAMTEEERSRLAEEMADDHLVFLLSDLVFIFRRMGLISRRCSHVDAFRRI